MLLGEGVPVSPTTLFTNGMAFLSARNLFACGFLKLESSSITIMSNGHPFLSPW